MYNVIIEQKSYYFSVLAMGYTLVIVKDSRKLRDARLAREATKLASAKYPDTSHDVPSSNIQTVL